MKMPSTVNPFCALIILLGFFFVPASFAAQQTINPITGHDTPLDPSQHGKFLNRMGAIAHVNWMLPGPAR